MTSFRTVCTTQAAASLSSGALLLLLPSPVLGLFSLPADVGTQIVARMLGGILFALGATLLGARDVTAPDQRIRIMLGNAVCDGCIAVILAAALTQLVSRSSQAAEVRHSPSKRGSRLSPIESTI